MGRITFSSAALSRKVRGIRGDSEYEEGTCSYHSFLTQFNSSLWLDQSKDINPFQPFRDGLASCCFPFFKKLISCVTYDFMFQNITEGKNGDVIAHYSLLLNNFCSAAVCPFLCKHRCLRWGTSWRVKLPSFV